MIPLLQTKTADTAHTGIFASNTIPDFWAGTGDKASAGIQILYTYARERVGSAWGRD